MYITLTAPLNVLAVNDTYVAAYNQPYSPPLSELILANDYSPSANPQLQVVSTGAPVTPGTVTNYTAAGSFVFTPEPGWVGALAGGGQVGCVALPCTVAGGPAYTPARNDNTGLHFHIPPPRPAAQAPPRSPTR